MKELELKLGCLPTVAASVGKLLFLKDLESESKLLLNLYYDTPDEQLKKLKVALRIRKAGNRWLQTLKTAGATDASGLSVRGEFEFQIDGPNLNLDLIKDHLPATIELDQLYPVFSTNFKRNTWLYQQGDTAVEIACDQGEVRTGNRIEPISEIELELKKGDVSVLFEIAQNIANELPVWVGQRSKAQRGQELRFEHPPLRDLPSMVLSEPTDEAKRQLLSELTIAWQSYFELLNVSRAPEIVTSLCSAIERLLSVLRQLPDSEKKTELTNKYNELLQKCLPLMDLAYFSGSDPAWYKTLQEQNKFRVAELLADKEIGKLALNTASFLLQV